MLNFNIEQLLDVMPLNIYWKDISGHYLRCNAAQAHFFGLKDPSEIIGKTDLQLSSDHALAEKWMKNDQKVIQEGIAIITEETATINGNAVTGMSCKIPFKDSHGNIAGMMGITVDITAQKIIEERLIQEKKSAQIVLDNIIARLPGHVYWMDKENRYLGCNDLQAKNLGLKGQHEIIGKANHELCWAEHADEINAVNHKVMAEKQEIVEEESAKLVNGSTGIFLSRKTPLLDDQGDIVGVLGISFDITDRKKMEEELVTAKIAAESANRVKTEFLANMSHDVRSPMMGILTFAELMMLDPNWRTPEEAEQIHSCAKQVLQFFDSCLELSKLEMSELDSEQVVFSLPDMLNEIHALFVPRAQSKGLSFHVDYDTHLPKIFLGHRGSLYRVMLNLVGNAVKFTGSGNVTVRAFIAEYLKDKVQVGIEVKDTGPGIPEDKHQAIFEKLRRLTPSHEGKVEGSGIGLYIVDQYIKHMQGKITVKSTVGQGSTFTVLLPMGVASEKVTNT